MCKRRSDMPKKLTIDQVAKLVLPGATSLALTFPTLAQELTSDGPFAEAEMPVEKPAQCHEIKDAIRDVPTPGGLDRIDFAAVGPLKLVKFDGVLAYMGICGEPDAKVLCVTYSTNNMKPSNGPVQNEGIIPLIG
jgi:hypothetical protein